MGATDSRLSVEEIHMSVTESDDDRYCRHCDTIGLAFDPAAGRARCRFCGSLV
ncbi:hypothetical protein ACFQJ5_12730 [Halomicroarcula sp. GCM10025324]|uniref:hypothetical protein n=1 Tax=Halomicroarcula sp. GCM10025324 TaxID=3252667 RepID=UPI0036173D17